MARATSRWLANLSRPRLANRTRSRCAVCSGGGPGGPATREPREPREAGAAPGRVDGVLPVLPEPFAVKTRIEVIPGQDLGVASLPGGVPGEINRLVRERFRGAALPALVPEVLAPAIETAAVLPYRPDHLGHAPVTTGEQALNDRGLTLVVAVTDAAAIARVAAQRAAERGEPAIHSRGVALACPLKRRVRLWHKRAYRHGATNVTAPGCLPPGLNHPPGEARDREHVLVCLGRQAAHEIELHLPPAAGICGGHGANQILLGDHLVDHLADPLRAALGREGQSGATAVTAQLVGERDVEGVNPGGRQRKARVRALVPVGKPLRDLVDLAVV